MSAQATEDSVLIHTYRRLVPDPTAVTPRDRAVGFGAAGGGALLSLAGCVAYAWTVFGGVERYVYWALRELAFGSVALGLVLVLAGVLTAVGGVQKAGWMVGLGVSLCLVAIGIFAYGYPTDWNVITPPDYSTIGAPVYALGLGLLLVKTGRIVQGRTSA